MLLRNASLDRRESISKLSGHSLLYRTRLVRFCPLIFCPNFPDVSSTSKGVVKFYVKGLNVRCPRTYLPLGVASHPLRWGCRHRHYQYSPCCRRWGVIQPKPRTLVGVLSVTHLCRDRHRSPHSLPCYRRQRGEAILNPVHAFVGCTDAGGKVNQADLGALSEASFPVSRVNDGAGGKQKDRDEIDKKRAAKGGRERASKRSVTSIGYVEWCTTVWILLFPTPAE